MKNLRWSVLFLMLLELPVSASAQLSPAIAVWAFPDGISLPARDNNNQVVSGSCFLGVVAFHHSGIDRVVFTVSNGVSRTVSVETMNPQTGEVEFVLILDPALLVADGLYTLAAVAHPNNGLPHALPDRLIRKDTAVRNVYFVDSVAGDDDNPGTSEDPFETIRTAFDQATSGDIIKLKTGEYALDVDSNFGFDRFTTLLPDDGATPVITSRVGSVRAGFLKFDNLVFDWSATPATGNDGQISGEILSGWGPPHLWFKGCEFFSRAGSYNNYLRALSFWGDVNHVTAEGCLFHNVDKAMAFPAHSIMRGNMIGPGITSDAFNFSDNTLITGNQVFGIDTPHLHIQSTNSEPFDLATNTALTFFYDEFNTGSYLEFSFANVGELAANPAQATAEEIADQLMSNAAFAEKLTATASHGQLDVSANRTNYIQHLYVGGVANAAIGFTHEGLPNQAVGSGQHADVFQYWGDTKHDIVIRNNRAWDNNSQGLLPQTDTNNLAFVNNLLDSTAGQVWLINFENYSYNNVLFSHNTIWNAESSMHLQMSTMAPTNFVVTNNIFGPRTGTGDMMQAGYTMDYNIFDYYSSTGPNLNVHSLDTNPANSQPTPALLFRNVEVVFDVENQTYEYRGDFHHSPHSPALDMGTGISHIRYDLNWQLRDDTPDIGAYESGLVFCDGFELGNTSAWSLTVQ